jgi:hypothetical protein
MVDGGGGRVATCPRVRLDRGEGSLRGGGRFSVLLGWVVDGGRRTKEAIVKVNERTRSGDGLLGRYIDALGRYGEPEPDRSELAPGYDVRTCTHCGAHVIFLIDPRGGWAECDACGRAA